MNLAQLQAKAQTQCTYAGDPDGWRIYAAGWDVSATTALVERCLAEIDQKGVKARAIAAGSFGYYDLEPIAAVQRSGQPTVLYPRMTPDGMARLVREMCHDSLVLPDMALCSLGDSKIDGIPSAVDLPLFNIQQRRVLDHCGSLDPDDIYAYIVLAQGYAALAAALQMPVDQVLETVGRSGLQGRGGAGFPVAEKWRVCRGVAADEKIIVCNAVDGDPQARTAQMLLGGNPHSILEGLLISAYAVGASRCILCVNGDHESIVKRLATALGQMRACGLQGDNILDAGFQAEIEVHPVSPSLVIGEQTALLQALQGRQAMPYVRADRANHTVPSCVRGLDGKPTLVHNVETLAHVTAIFQDPRPGFLDPGAAAYKDTKVMTITGQAVRNLTLEVPLGTSVGRLLEAVGGIGQGKTLKAVQLGGPSGGFLVAQELDTAIDFETLNAHEAILGSGTIEVIAGDTCAVALAKEKTAYLQGQSCGKCVFCREGTLQLTDILESIMVNHAKPKDLDLIREIGEQMKKNCICNLGRTAALPVLSSLARFSIDFEAHIKDKRCPLGDQP